MKISLNIFNNVVLPEFGAPQSQIAPRLDCYLISEYLTNELRKGLWPDFSIALLYYNFVFNDGISSLYCSNVFIGSFLIYDLLASSSKYSSI